MTRVLKCLFLILLPLLFVSCSKDGNDEPNNDDPTENEEQTIVGEWKCDYDAYGEAWDKPLIYLFDEDGTGYEWFSDEPFSERAEFTYSCTSSKLSILYDYGDYEEYCELRYKLSSNGKILIIYGRDEDDLSELHLTRVR